MHGFCSVVGNPLESLDLKNGQGKGHFVGTLLDRF